MISRYVYWKKEQLLSYSKINSKYSKKIVNRDGVQQVFGKYLVTL